MAKAKSVVVNKEPATKKKPLSVALQLFEGAKPLVNAHNASDSANDAVSACRKDYFTLCNQKLGSKFYKADKSIVNQCRVAFYKAHFESKGLAVNVLINAKRGEIKSDSLIGAKVDAVKREADNAKSRFNKFISWCADEDAGKHAEKDSNNRQSNSGNKRTLNEIVQDNGQRLYNACYKAGKKDAYSELQSWATKHFKIKFTVPAGAKK
jgi:hypothetical protein